MEGEAEMKIALPWPPSVNHIYQHFGGRTILDPKVRAYRAQVGGIVASLKAAGKLNEQLSGNLFVRFDIYEPDARRRDLDNLLKAPFDALTKAGLWGDDSQIRKCFIQFMPEQTGCIVVVIEPLTESE